MESDSPEPLKPKDKDPQKAATSLDAPEAEGATTTSDPCPPPDGPGSRESVEGTPSSKSSVSQKETEALSLLDVLRISAVLEDTLGQLSILSFVMPVPYESEPEDTRGSREMGIDVPSPIVTGNKPETPTNSRRGTVPSLLAEGPKSTKYSLKDQEASQADPTIDHLINKPTKQTILTVETLKKVQADRQFASDVIAETLQEMQVSGMFTSLVRALEREKEKKTHFHDIVVREEQGRKQIRSLQKQLQDVKREREIKVQSQKEHIAYLKDQLQEMKAKTNMESRYVKKTTELQIVQTQNKCDRAEENLLDEIERLKLRTDEETRVHTEIENFLKKELVKLEEKLEYWMEKYDKDTEAKQNELNSLKSAKAADLINLQELARELMEFEQVIIEDRLEKEKARNKIEQDARELKSIIKLQAWWRGTVVRRELGNFKLPKKEKGGGKNGKGKGKAAKGGAKKKK
ncbi:dynein regulatory complex protein 9 isoform X2 [Tachyglossus aculeatus]|uniref:dynein regulatory complex protein 9 isoform X2 n=1 Tax=Tachyglossus aculeatus TaxID=9261 RepID=UPI0018F6975C|nr:dynein regulatory complex protein 9 isoform X2 [Tachyglossus aculeatus]